MNKLIFRKLSLDILAFFLLSTLAITMIVCVFQGVNLLDIVSEQGHGIKVYFIYTSLNIPKIFSKLLLFTYFLTLFVILSKYQDNNEILIFWTNGIKKISFINFIGKLSIFFMLLQLFLNLIIVPYTQNLQQQYLKNSSIEFFPKLIEQKKFSSIMKNLTIFIDEYTKEGELKGIYIKEKIDNTENKIITANSGKLFKTESGFSFKLIDGKITNITNSGSFNLGFKETSYELEDLNSKTRKEKKLNETETFFLINCLFKFIDQRKDSKMRCGLNNSFLVKNIYEELFKRAINPFYIIILSLLSSLIILKSKIIFFSNYYKSFLFLLGFGVIIFSELSYKFLFFSTIIELVFFFLPVLFIVIFYLFILIKTNFKINHL